MRPVAVCAAHAALRFVAEARVLSVAVQYKNDMSVPAGPENGQKPTQVPRKAGQRVQEEMLFLPDAIEGRLAVSRVPRQRCCCREVLPSTDQR